MKRAALVVTLVAALAPACKKAPETSPAHSATRAAAGDRARARPPAAAGRRGPAVAARPAADRGDGLGAVGPRAQRSQADRLSRARRPPAADPRQVDGCPGAQDDARRAAGERGARAGD